MKGNNQLKFDFVLVVHVNMRYSFNYKLFLYHNCNTFHEKAILYVQGKVKIKLFATVCMQDPAREAFMVVGLGLYYWMMSIVLETRHHWRCVDMQPGE